MPQFTHLHNPKHCKEFRHFILPTWHKESTHFTLPTFQNLNIQIPSLPLYLNQNKDFKNIERTIQRRKKRILWPLTKTNVWRVKHLTRNKTNYLQYTFGFTSDPYKKTNYNFQEALKQVEQSHTVISANQTSKKYTNKKDLNLLQPKNLAMHYLCQGIQPPLGTKNLLGLGLKFCLAPPNPLQTPRILSSK